MPNRKGITEITAPVAAGSADTPLAVHYANEQQGGMKYFKTNTERDAFKAKYKPRLFRSVAYVHKGDNNYPSLYAWSGSNPNGTDGDWQFISYAGGFVLGDESGGVPNLISTLILGDDFVTQSAGDKGDGALVQLSDAVKQSISNAAKSGSASFDKLGPYLEVNTDGDGKKMLMVKPDSFQLASNTGYLAYMRYSELLIGKPVEGDKYRKGALWFDMTAVSANGMLQMDRNNKAIGLQEVDLGDPSVTGGSKFLVWPFIYLDGTAPDDGYVELVLFEKDTGDIATDINGHAMAARHNYKYGQLMTPKHDPLTFCQVIAAKGVKEYGLALIDSFDDFIRILDYSEGPSGLCIQEISADGNSSEALLKAEIDTGFNVRVEMYYADTYLASTTYVASIPQASKSVPALSYVRVAGEFDLFTLTDVELAVSQGQIQIKNKDGAIGDFYIGLVLHQELSVMLAGKGIGVDVSLIDKDDGWDIGFFTYDGDQSNRPPLYTSRTNGSINLNAGWSKFDSGFISEDAVSGLHAQSFSATIPRDSKFVMAALYPTEAQNPITLNLKGYALSSANPETLYEINPINISGLQHIDFITNTIKMVQDNQSYNSLRYTIDSSQEGNAIPFGIPKNKPRFVHLDKTKNVISGSSAKGGEGAIVDDEPVKVTIYQKWQLYNEQPSTDSVDFWLVLHKAGDGSEHEIVGSRTTFEVDSKRAGVDYFQTNEVSVNLEPGDYIYARASASVDDGVYAQTNTKASPLCITYLTEKGLA